MYCGGANCERQRATPPQSSEQQKGAVTNEQRLMSEVAGQEPTAAIVWQAADAVEGFGGGLRLRALENVP